MSGAMAMSGANGEKLVQVRDVFKRFGKTEIVRGVSFDVARGEVVALVGSSGAGKSTLIRCINYLTPFEAGEIRLGEHVLRPGMRLTESAVRAARKDAGMVFQDFQLFPHLSARDNVALGPRHVLGLPLKEARDRADRLLRRVQLSEEKASLMPAQLSGGQRQRVGIARALAMEPKVVLLDEPTSALDPELKAEVAAVIVSLKKDGLTMIIVTHEFDLARAASDRVVRLAGGKIEAIGTPAEVLK